MRALRVSVCLGVSGGLKGLCILGVSEGLEGLGALG